MNEKTLHKPVVENALTDLSRVSATHHSVRRRSHRSSSTLLNVNRKLVIALSASLSVLFLVIIFSVVRVSGLDRENDALQTELSKARQELGQILPELEQSRKIVAEITKGRLPSLLDLVPDKVIKINDLYFKNILFTVLNKNGMKTYEYKLVMENSTPKTARPSARIIVFDRYGVQIGSAEVAGRVDLAPGESRSQSAMIDRFIDGEPYYFYVSKLPADKPSGLAQ